MVILKNITCYIYSKLFNLINLFRCKKFIVKRQINRYDLNYNYMEVMFWENSERLSSIIIKYEKYGHVTPVEGSVVKGHLKLNQSDCSYYYTLKL